jgi:histidine triad (HIT) family protein
MDIMPRSDGHALVIPKKPARNILDASPEILAPVIRTVQRVAVAARTAFNADGVTVSQFSEHAGGQVVFHLHVHVLPRFSGVDLRPAGIMGDSTLLEQHAAKLRAAMT